MLFRYLELRDALKLVDVFVKTVMVVFKKGHFCLRFEGTGGNAPVMLSCSDIPGS